MSLLRRALCTYKYMLYKHPYMVQAGQIPLLMGAGDVFTQTLERRQHFDFLRTARFMSAGAFLGPTMHAWYTLLDKLFGRCYRIKPAILKVITDQIIFAPLYVAAMLCYVHLIHGHNWKEAKRSYKQDYKKLLIDNYKIFPAAQLFNFTLISLSYRVFFIQTVGILWYVYLALKRCNEVKDSSKNKK